MTRKFFLVATTVVALGGSAQAQGIDPIQMRQVGMDLLAGTFAGMNATVAGNGDIKKLEAGGNGIKKWATLIPVLFPAGSDKGTTKASVDIWTDRAGFEKDAQALLAGGEAIAAAAKAGDATALATAIKATGDACGACHKAYRLK
jgi:cytochrome c556